MMNAIKKKAGEYTPRVYLDLETNRFEIGGKSLPENVNDFYEPIILWLSVNLDLIKDGSEFIIQMTIINSATARIYSIHLGFRRS